MLEAMTKLLSHPLASVGLGAVITWVVAWYYYKRAGDELKAEASQLKKTTNLILRWLENRGENIEVIRDSSGAPTGLRHQASITEGLTVGVSVIGGELRTVDAPDAQQSVQPDRREDAAPG